MARKRPFNGALLTLDINCSFEKRKGKVAREISPQWGYRVRRVFKRDVEKISGMIERVKEGEELPRLEDLVS